MKPGDYRHWRIDKDEQQLLWLTFDHQEQSANTFNAEVLDELDEIITYVKTETAASGLIIQSAKPTGFCAGADVHYIEKHLADPKALLVFVDKGRQVFARLADISLPTVALINGYCMGGGLELALACRYRLATDDQKTRLGLPEVQLGIIPAWGGLQRLPCTIGALPAFSMMLTGRPVSAQRAKRLGLVDAVVPQRQLVHAAKYYVDKKPATSKPGVLQRLVEVSPVRKIMAKILRQQLAGKVKSDQYPAPYMMVDQWARLGAHNPQLQTVVANEVGHLMGENSTASNLLRVFMLRERLQATAKDTNFTARTVHVIGAGAMGSDIAAWCVLQGLQVTLQDREPQYLSAACKRAGNLFTKKLKKRQLIQAAQDRLIPDLGGDGIGRADVIIEAVYEDATLKQALFRQIEQRARPEAILATNTSSIPLDEINRVMQRADRLVGIHFFNPVAKMLLVEIVQGDKTAVEVVQNATAFIHQIKRLPITVKSCPGFLVNRILMPYLLEAVRLLAEGQAAEVIDKAATDFGMAMGPIQLADRVGLDVCLAVADHLAPHFPYETVPQQLREMVAQGKLGVKKDQGFYRYRKGRLAHKKSTISKDAHTITDRLIYRILNEAAACLREGVVADGDLLDAAMVFGTGFAPFRGGPVQYMKTQGLQQIQNTAGSLAQEFGGRFSADPYLSELL